MEEDNGEDEDEEQDEQRGIQQTNLYPLKKRSCVPSSSTSRRSVKPEKMGEIIEVQGGHIVRAIGRKDRHSKVCTAKGTRDRRVRLSAPTAIQFYDVQDRLGYDRPSKAVDWLIKKAKPAIDELEKLPPWKPPTLTSSVGVETSIAQVKKQSDNIQCSTSNSVYDFHDQMNTTNNANFLTPFDDSLRSFFPIASSSSSSSLQFQSYSPELLPRTTNQIQDLRLSLQSLQDPMLHHQPPPPPHHHHHHHHLSSSAEQSAIFAGSNLSFDTNTSSWPDQNPNEANGIQRLIGFNGFDANVGGYVFNFPVAAQAEPPPHLFNPNQFFTQRGPLQSSNSPPIRAWMDPIIEDHQIPISGDQSGTISGIGLMTDSSFTRFRLPARIQGEQEQDDIADRQLSGSSAHRH